MRHENSADSEARFKRQLTSVQPEVRELALESFVDGNSPRSYAIVAEVLRLIGRSDSTISGDKECLAYETIKGFGIAGTEAILRILESEDPKTASNAFGIFTAYYQGDVPSEPWAMTGDQVRRIEAGMAHLEQLNPVYNGGALALASLIRREYELKKK